MLNCDFSIIYWLSYEILKLEFLIIKMCFLTPPSIFGNFIDLISYTISSSFLPPSMCSDNAIYVTPLYWKTPHPPKKYKRDFTRMKWSMGIVHLNLAGYVKQKVGEAGQVG